MIMTNTEQVPKDWEAGEAFALMWYQCKFCGHRERLWNSRKGVTPFAIDCTSCDEAGSLVHSDWQKDQRRLDYKPNHGQRIFIDLTLEKARAYAKRQMESDPDQEGIIKQFGSVAEAIELIAQHNYKSFGEGTTPDLVRVGVDTPYPFVKK